MQFKKIINIRIIPLFLCRNEEFSKYKYIVKMKPNNRHNFKRRTYAQFM